MFLSVVIPAHREGERLARTIMAVQQYVAGEQYESEILVIEHGTSQPPEISEGVTARDRPIRWLHERQGGKGFLVRRGMLAASGRYRFVCDADLSMPIEQVARFLPPALIDADIAVGSRSVTGASRHGEPLYRRAMSRTFNHLVQRSVLPGFADTQCGFKCFEAGAAEDLFGVQLMDGMSFDVEVLCIARQRGYRIVEVPIDWHYREGSRVRLVQDPIAMVRDLVRIRQNLDRGKYENARPHGPID